MVLGFLKYAFASEDRSVKFISCVPKKMIKRRIMMKYEDVPEIIYEMYGRIVSQHFPYLANAKILFLINKRKMVKKGNIVLGKMVKSTELVKYLSRNEAPEDGYDYIMLLDSKLIMHCEEADIERVIRHELRHIFFDSDSKSPYKLIDHDFSDFYDEVELNKDDPTWANRVSKTVSLIYHQEKDQN
jgi:hypothetical protein